MMGIDGFMTYFEERNCPPQDLELIELAGEFACHEHGDQTRKGPETEPYVEHCYRVAQNVFLLTSDPCVVAAAVLHDTVEDCEGVEEATIFNRFGPYVCDLVMAVTNRYTHEAYPDLNRETRFQFELERMRVDFEQTPAARLIKLCDIMDNKRTIHLTGKGGWVQKWTREKDQQLELIFRQEIV